jgi:hypothetical protein
MRDVIWQWELPFTIPSNSQSCSGDVIISHPGFVVNMTGFGQAVFKSQREGPSAYRDVWARNALTKPQESPEDS